MVILKHILIPEDQISLIHSEARSDASCLVSNVNFDLDDDSYDSPYLNYLVLTHLRDRLPANLQEEPLILYNRYFWFRRFIRMHSTKHGKVAGLEQQAFQILEHSMADLDWQVIEAIDELTGESAL
jgi:hypothetical protein